MCAHTRRGLIARNDREDFVKNEMCENDYAGRGPQTPCNLGPLAGHGPRPSVICFRFLGVCFSAWPFWPLSTETNSFYDLIRVLYYLTENLK